MGKLKNLPCGIGQVVDLLGIDVVRRTATQWHCRCPFCNDRKAHMNVLLSDDVFRCNRCGRGGAYSTSTRNTAASTEAPLMKNFAGYSAKVETLCRMNGLQRWRQENGMLLQRRCETILTPTCSHF